MNLFRKIWYLLRGTLVIIRMNKDNIFKTSEFHMDKGDVLHMIIDNETGEPILINLNSTVGGETESISDSSLQDKDGNYYTSVIIGTQEWMIENLKTTKYADGTAIPNLTNGLDWIAEDGSGGHDGAYCCYDNIALNLSPYGALYNWYAVNNAHGLAPTGWRVPTDSDYLLLVAFLGGLAVTGGKLKETGFTHWNSPNLGATDDYGFKGLPSGWRFNVDGLFSAMGTGGILWSSTAISASDGGIFDLLHYTAAAIQSNDAKNAGYAVRCMRDI
jgi:uncharacterized protein (TIGR02145 family)